MTKLYYASGNFGKPAFLDKLEAQKYISDLIIKFGASKTLNFSNVFHEVDLRDATVNENNLMTLPARYSASAIANTSDETLLLLTKLAVASAQRVENPKDKD